MAAVAITLMIPQRIIAPFSIYIGQVWYAAPEIAQFDIAIEKSKSEIDREKDSILSSFLPIYRLDTILSAKRIASLEALLDINASLTIAQKERASKVIRDIYRAGVMSNDEYRAIENHSLRIVEGSTITPIHSEDIYSIKNATQAITESTPIPAQSIAATALPNMAFDTRLNAAMREEAINSLSKVRGMVRKGDKIVDRNEVITPEKFNILNSMMDQRETREDQQGSPYMVFLGQFFIIFSLLILNHLFFKHFAQYYFGQGLREITFVLFLYLVMAGFMCVVARLDGVSPYVVPLPAVAVYCLAFFNMRVAILTNLTVAFIGAMFVRQPFDFFAVNMFTGMVAILMMRHNYHRGFLMRAVGVLLLTSILIFTCFSLLRQGGFANISYWTYIWLAVSAFLLLAFYQAIYLMERMFGFVSDITLLELCDTNQKLLLDLAHNAPGTFQHSVQVANLAESAAKEIGANALLCRTGALYHDIGKMENPFYFVENLTGVFNPHDDCTPTQSAQIVKAHLTDGLATARKHKLPEMVTDFISSHHGTSLIYFFWVAAQKENPQANVADFTYDGPLPSSREVSICMMADAVEAASRSLPSYDKEPLEALVDKIIDTQIQSGQMADSALSFQDIAKIKAVFKTKLSNIYHGRIAYPARN